MVALIAGGSVTQGYASADSGTDALSAGTAFVGVDDRGDDDRGDDDRDDDGNADSG